MHLPSPVKLLLGAVPLAALATAFMAAETGNSLVPAAQAQESAGYADTAAGLPTTCLSGTYGRSGYGTSMWPKASSNLDGIYNETNCMIDQYSINNFLYLVGTGASGHPRFMEMAPWYTLMTASGTPTWPGTYSPLQSTQLKMKQSEEEAGDGFELMDVADAMTSYDIRVNQPFFDSVVDNQYYTQAALTAAQTAFQTNSATGGVWLPPTDPTAPGVGAIEIKTAWRNYGAATAGACPGDIMHCETDSSGTAWGLVGFHLVQKSTDHGEFVWATFEHIGNAPDCVPGGTSPISKEPADPVNAGSTINVNKNISGLKDQTGWNYFNFTSYGAAGGDGKFCPYPGWLGAKSQQCLTSPEGQTAGDWVQVNVCRTDPLPAADACANSMGFDNGSTIACLNQDMLTNFPAVLDAKWKYYQLVGMEWLFNGSSTSGAQIVGCFTYDEDDSADACPNYKLGPSGGKLGDGVGAPSYTRTGSTSMANTTLETWMQKNMVLTTKSGNTVTATDCFGCHQPQTAGSPGQIYQGDMSHLFGRAQQ